MYYATPPSDDAAWTLSNIRYWWQKEYREDIFASYNADPEKLSKTLRANFQGDINQISHQIDGVTVLLDYLKTGFSPQTPLAQRIAGPPQEPSDPAKPFIIIELLVQNSGRTETLLRDSALLRLRGKEFTLKGINTSVGFDVYSGKFFDVKPASVQSVAFSHHPNETTLAELHDMKQLLLDRTHKARIIVKDFGGKTHSTAWFTFREDS